MAPRRPRPTTCVLLALTLLAAPPVVGQAVHHGQSPEATADHASAASRVAEYRGIVDALIDEALQNGRGMERLVELCTVAPHRLAGSEGYERAADWAEAVMRADGLANVRRQTVMATHWERGSVGEVTIVEPAVFAGESLAMLALGGSVATPPDGVVAEVVLCHGLEAADELGERAGGKIVLFNKPLDRRKRRTFTAYGGAVGQRGRGASTAARLGAVGAFVRSMTTRLDDFPHTGGMRYADDAPKIPTAALSTLATERVEALIAAGHKVVVRFRQDCKSLPDTPNDNVIGEYLGREHPEQILVVGGHLDAWGVGQGAHDDGGGCVQALEAVRLMATLGLRPRRTIRVVMFANEENGLAGGRGYAEHHAEEMPNHVLAMESDAGAFTPRGFRTNANPQARETLEAISELLATAGAGSLDQAGSGGADIGPMRRYGVVQLGFMPDSQRYFDLHHSARDTLEQVSDRELHLGAAVMAAMLYIVADLEQTLPRNPLPDQG